MCVGTEPYDAAPGGVGTGDHTPNTTPLPTYKGPGCIREGVPPVKGVMKSDGVREPSDDICSVAVQRDGNRRSVLGVPTGAPPEVREPMADDDDRASVLARGLVSDDRWPSKAHRRRGRFVSWEGPDADARSSRVLESVGEVCDEHSWGCGGAPDPTMVLSYMDIPLAGIGDASSAFLVPDGNLLTVQPALLPRRRWRWWTLSVVDVLPVRRIRAVLIRGSRF